MTVLRRHEARTSRQEGLTDFSLIANFVLHFEICTSRITVSSCENKTKDVGGFAPRAPPVGVATPGGDGEITQDPHELPRAPGPVRAGFGPHGVRQPARLLAPPLRERE